MTRERFGNIRSDEIRLWMKVLRQYEDATTAFGSLHFVFAAS
jgi:hypothetical protein